MKPKDQVESWFLTYGDDVYRFLLYFKGSSDVEDLLQETFLRALRSYGDYKGHASPKTWLLKIARNLVIDESRRKRPVLVDEEYLNQQEDTKPSPETHVEERDLHETLSTTLMQLDEKHRDVLILRCVHDLSFKQIAGLVGCNEVTARSRFHRAKKLAEEILADLRKGGMLA